MKSKTRILLGLLLLLAGCATAPEKASFTPVSFADLPGWSKDTQSEALTALNRSCAVHASPTCAMLAQVPAGDDAAAREFFEAQFQPYTVNDGEQGLFTGYYEPELRGSLARTGKYTVPLYARPGDLIGVDLGLFVPEWKGKHIAGKVEGQKLVPYDDRAAITESGLGSRAQVLVWVDDPVDAFFLSIQGSGRVKLPDGKILRLGYDGANGHSYAALGKILLDRGELQKPVTMPAIRAWLAAHPDAARAAMNENPSYIFFRILEGDGPIGAEGVALTPERSMAVDPKFIPFGAPLWLDTQDAFGARLQRLMLAQDTGGAIKGPVRGDFFWGAGAHAAEEAGAMQSRGRYFILLPKTADATR